MAEQWMTSREVEKLFLDELGSVNWDNKFGSRLQTGLSIAAIGGRARQAVLKFYDGEQVHANWTVPPAVWGLSRSRLDLGQDWFGADPAGDRDRLPVALRSCQHIELFGPEYEIEGVKSFFGLGGPAPPRSRDEPIASGEALGIGETDRVNLGDVSSTAPGAANGGDPPRSGSPGRPSSMHLILALFEERAKQGKIATAVTIEAREVLAEFKSNPDWANYPRPTPGTIENAIRERFRAIKPPTKL